MISKNLEQAVECKNITNIRSSLKTCMSQDPNFTNNKYNESLKFILNNGILKEEIFDKHDNKKFKCKEEWSKEYLNSVMADLLFNFSEERIEFIKELGRFLYPVNKDIRKKNCRVEGKKNSMLPIIVGVTIVITILIILTIKQKIK